jgi:hypothetical protein
MKILRPTVIFTALFCAASLFAQTNRPVKYDEG